MLNSDVLNTFIESRDDFKPYGLTCALWKPNLMRRPDRHNEIEINFFTEGSITYLFQDKRVTIPEKRLAVFWGLVPHQIVQFEGNAPYYVCTIPLAQFLAWKLPASFIDRIVTGEVLLETSGAQAPYDEHLLKGWLTDINSNHEFEVVLLELQARMYRMALSNLPKKQPDYSPVQPHEISQVEKIAVYIAQNYAQPIKVCHVGQAVGLHPDYANLIFKKAFGKTLNEYITEERIAHAQRKLVTTGMSITEVAFDCGFNSISRFNAAFLAANGCTPREFRKRYQ